MSGWLDLVLFEDWAATALLAVAVVLVATGLVRLDRGRGGD